MTKYSGSEDVYKELVQDSDENWLYGLVSFAVVEEQRIEWMRHYEKQNQALPSAAEIRLWYEQQPSSVLLRAKGTAENALQAYSADVLEITLEDQRKAVEESIVVAEIRELRSFWPQFGVNFAGGFASALLLAALITVVAFLVFNDASLVKIGEELRGNLEVIENGEK